MKRYYIYLTVFLVSICNSVFSQTPATATGTPAAATVAPSSTPATPAAATPAAAAAAPSSTPATPAAAAPSSTPAATPAVSDNGAIVMLTFNANGTASLDKHFPFDKWFTIRLAGIPAAVDKIEIRLQGDANSIADYKNKSGTGNSTTDMILPEWIRGNITPPQTTGEINVRSRLKYNSNFLVKITSFSTKPLTEDQKPALRNALSIDPAIAAIVAKMGKVSAVSEPSILVDYRTEIIDVLKKSLQKINANYSFKEPEVIPVVKILRDFRQGIHAVEDPIGDFETNSKQSDAKKASLRKAFNQLNWGTLQISSPEYKTFKELIESLIADEPADTKPAIKMSLNSIISAIEPTLANRTELIQALVDRVALTDAYEASVFGTSYDDKSFEKFAGSYITLDIGIPYVARVDRVIMYSGINIYSRPIDKGIPLEQYSGLDNFRARTSLLLGISLASIEKDGQRKGLIGSNAGVIGLGYRVFPFLKFTTGFFCHYRYNNNPGIDLGRYNFSTSPFFGISIDSYVKQIFSAFGTPFQ